MGNTLNGFIFDIGTLNFSTIDTVYNTTTYYGRIMNFSGVTMRVDLTSRLIAPNKVQFEVDNADGTYSLSSFEDKTCTITLLKAGNYFRSWRFYIKKGRARDYYGKIRVEAEGLLQNYLTGDFPNTPLVVSEYPTEPLPANTSACVPFVIGEAHIPVTPGMYDPGTGEEWYYILGPDATYSFFTSNAYFIQAPREVNTGDKWGALDYTFNLSDIAGETITCTAVQCLIHDSDDDGSEDANGIWVGGSGVLSPIMRYRNTDVTQKAPGSFIKYILEQFGVPSGDMYAASFTGVDTALSGGNLVTGYNVLYNMAFWQKEPRENLLSELLQSCDCFLAEQHYLTLNLFDSASQATFDTDDIDELTFSASFVDISDIDGVEVAYIKSGKPYDQLTGRATVPLYSAQSSISNVAEDVWIYRPYEGSNIIPLVMGQCVAQKKYDTSHKAAFSVSVFDTPATSSVDNLIPGQVVTIARSSAYGTAAQEVLITEIEFTPDLHAKISGNVYLHDLEDCFEVSQNSATTVSSESSADYAVRPYTVVNENDATSDIRLINDTINFPAGVLKADTHSAFQVSMSADQSNITADATVTVQFDTEDYDNAGDYDTGTYTFTAPNDGWYQFNVNLLLGDIDTGGTKVSVRLVTSNETFFFEIPATDLTADSNKSAAFSQLAWLDEDDTAKVQIKPVGGASQLDVLDDASYFSGFYVNQ